MLHIMNDGAMASLPLLLPFLKTEFGLDFTVVGLLSGVLGFAGIFLSLPAALAAKRFGGFRILAGGAILYAASFFILAAARTPPLLFIAFALASIGFGSFHPIGFSLVASNGKPEGLGKRMGNFTAVGDIGRMGLAALVTALTAYMTWRPVALLYGALPLAFLVLLLARGRLRSQERREGTDPARSGLDLSALDRRLLPIFTSGFVDSLASSSLFVFLPFLFAKRGISPALLGSLSGAFFLGNMLGKVALGGIVDRLPGRKVFIASECLMAALLVTLGLAGSVFAMVPVSILLGMVTKGTVPVINTLLAKASGNGPKVEAAFALGSTLGGIAAVLSPLLFGVVSDRFGVEMVFFASAFLAMLAILPMLGVRRGENRARRTGPGI